MRDLYTKLPFPPSLWQAYKQRGYSKYKSAEYVAFQEQCLAALAKAKFVFPKENELYIDIILFSSKWYNKDGSIKERDLDNYLKCVIDTIVVYCRRYDKTFDDRKIFSLSASKRVLKGSDDYCLVSLSARDPRE